MILGLNPDLQLPHSVTELDAIFSPTIAGIRYLADKVKRVLCDEFLQKAGGAILHWPTAFEFHNSVLTLLNKNWPPL